MLVVGAGQGGATCAWQMAEHGLDVLLLDSGSALPGATPPRTGRRADRDRADGRLTYYATDDDPDAPPHPVPTRLGLGPGGSAALYEAALGRLKRSDFERHREVPGHRALPNDWPVDYDLFRGYYARAEALMRMKGSPDPQDPDDDAVLGTPPGLGPADDEIITALRANGCAPYRLRVGFDYVAGCDECVGRRCLRGCRADGGSRALQAALARGRTTFVAGTTVHAVAPEGDGFRVTGATPEGERSWHARRVVLAAGALVTPLILARSHALWTEGGVPELLGRGLMFHVSDRFTVRGLPTNPPGSPRKTIGLRDFYDDGRVDIGEIHSAGSRISAGILISTLRARIDRRPWRRLRWMLHALRPFAWTLAAVWGPAPIFATITEDLPLARNRVVEVPAVAPGATPPPLGQIVVDYRPPPGLAEKVLRSRGHIREAFAPYPVTFLSAPGTPNWGHPMGTCRMGTDPAVSVVDAEGGLWRHPGLFVADASVFPSAGGTGPSLTVLAHALRVADRVAGVVPGAGIATADNRPAVPPMRPAG